MRGLREFLICVSLLGFSGVLGAQTPPIPKIKPEHLRGTPTEVDQKDDPFAGGSPVIQGPKMLFGAPLADASKGETVLVLGNKIADDPPPTLAMLERMQQAGTLSFGESESLIALPSDPTTSFQITGIQNESAAAQAARDQASAHESILQRDPPLAYPQAELRAMDKITARLSTLEVPVGQQVTFGTLAITVRTCQKNPPTEPPEDASFMEIDDIRPNRLAKRVFSGWMFASRPAISALEHPIYDVWVVKCRKASKSSLLSVAGN